MTKNDTGGPAFPLNGGIEQLECNLPVQGMSMRDYFAAKAMLAFIQLWVRDGKDTTNTLAETAYKMADAMIEARK